MSHSEQHSVIEVEFSLNGRPQKMAVPADEPLLTTLRERCGLVSLKDGCRPQGQCGACLALVNGHPRTTCTLPTHMVDGADVETMEFLPEEERNRLASAFTKTGAVQCGACIPGIALHAKSLVDRHPEPTHDEILKALDMHLCRCGGYPRIIQAIEEYARMRKENRCSEPLRAGGVGAPIARLDAQQAVLGTLTYTADLVFEDMLFGTVLLSPHPRALVRSIDVSAARALAGVRAVITAGDVPGNRWYGLIEKDWPGFVAVGEEVRCVGDVLAAVAADNETIARKALELIRVDYEVLPPILSVEESLAEGAPQINPKHSNVLSRSRLLRGDAEKALAESAHVVSGTWQTQRIEHLFIGLECAVARPMPNGRLHLYTQGQGIFDDRRQVAQFLGMDEQNVYVELLPSGGAFGGKEDLSIQAHTALLALKTGRPVKIALNREESIRMHPKRHPIKLHYTVGCDAEGNVKAVKARISGDSGAYASVGAKVLERAAGHACGPYRVPSVDVESVAAYTNNPPCGAMRGFGVNQVTFALEGALDMLAEKAGIDRFEFRMKNAVNIGDSLATGQILKSSLGIKKTLLAVQSAYEEAKRSGRAVGIACGMKNSGLGNGVVETSRACLIVEASDRIALYCGFTEMGQGYFTVMGQIAAEASALPSAIFFPRTNSNYEAGGGQTTGSRGTLLGGRAVIDAAKKLRADLDAGANLSDLIGRNYEGEVRISDTTPIDADILDPKTHTAYGFATQLCILDEHGHIAKMIAAHDVGHAINPAFCVNQLEGAVVMGLGYALTEELVCENGMPVTFWLRDLGALRARDIPPIDVILVEEPEPEGPYGAKGIGEIGLVPTAAAVASALKAFDGNVRYELPMKTSPAALAMSVGPHRAHHHHSPPPSSRSRVHRVKH